MTVIANKKFEIFPSQRKMQMLLWNLTKYIFITITFLLIELFQSVMNVLNTYIKK